MQAMSLTSAMTCFWFSVGLPLFLIFTQNLVRASTFDSIGDYVDVFCPLYVASESNLEDNLISQDEFVSHLQFICESTPTCNGVSDSFESLYFPLQYYFALATCDNPVSNESGNEGEIPVDGMSSMVVIEAMILNFRSQGVCVNNSTDVGEDSVFGIVVGTENTQSQVDTLCNNIGPILVDTGIITVSPTPQPALQPVIGTPTIQPTSLPMDTPTMKPIPQPAGTPTMQLSSEPSFIPSLTLSFQPSISASPSISSLPSKQPSISLPVFEDIAINYTVQISCENTTEDDCESESERKKSLTNATKHLLTNSTCQADDFSHVLSQDQIYVYYDDWIPKASCDNGYKCYVVLKTITANTLLIDFVNEIFQCAINEGNVFQDFIDDDSIIDVHSFGSSEVPQEEEVEVEVEKDDDDDDKTIYTYSFIGIAGLFLCFALFSSRIDKINDKVFITFGNNRRSGSSGSDGDSNMRASGSDMGENFSTDKRNSEVSFAFDLQRLPITRAPDIESAEQQYKVCETTSLTNSQSFGYAESVVGLNSVSNQINDAIEANNWERVGALANMMNEVHNDVMSVSTTSNYSRSESSGVSHISDENSVIKRERRAAYLSQRGLKKAEELDRLMEDEDWEAVKRIASSFSNDDGLIDKSSQMDQEFIPIYKPLSSLSSEKMLDSPSDENKVDESSLSLEMLKNILKNNYNTPTNDVCKNFEGSEELLLSTLRLMLQSKRRESGKSSFDRRRSGHSDAVSELTAGSNPGSNPSVTRRISIASSSNSPGDQSRRNSSESTKNYIFEPFGDDVSSSEASSDRDADVGDVKIPSLDDMAKRSQSFGDFDTPRNEDNSISKIRSPDDALDIKNLRGEAKVEVATQSEGSSEGSSSIDSFSGLMPLRSPERSTLKRESSFKERIITLTKEVMPEELDSVDIMIAAFKDDEQGLIDMLEKKRNEMAQRKLYARAPPEKDSMQNSEHGIEVVKVMSRIPENTLMSGEKGKKHDKNIESVPNVSEDGDDISTKTTDDSSNAFRKQVLELCEKGCPEEIDHIDEMIRVFDGEKEELLSILRSRVSAQMKEKDDTTKDVGTEGRSKTHSRNMNETDNKDRNGNDALRIENPSVHAEFPSSSSPRSQLSGSSVTELDEAIRIGDWKAVAERAAALQDADSDSSSSIMSSLTSGTMGGKSTVNQSTSSIRSSNVMSFDGSSSLSSIGDITNISESYSNTKDEEQLRRLEDLIDAGDWQALANVAEESGTLRK